MGAKCFASRATASRVWFIAHVIGSTTNCDASKPAAPEKQKSRVGFTGRRSSIAPPETETGSFQETSTRKQARRRMDGRRSSDGSIFENFGAVAAAKPWRSPFLDEDVDVRLILGTAIKFADLGHARRVYAAAVHRSLRAGTTTCAWFATLHLDASKLLVDVVRACGQRAHVGKVSMDTNAPESYVEQTDGAIALAGLARVNMKAGAAEIKLLKELGDMDFDGDGLLTFDEMCSYFAQVGTALNDEEFDLIVEEMRTAATAYALAMTLQE